MLLGGVVVGNFAFEPGNAISARFIVGAESMQVTIPFGNVNHAPVDRVEVVDEIGNVTGRDCAVMRDSPARPSPPQSVVFIRPDSVRPGCGISGRRVQFYSDGAALDPVIDWVAGAAGRVDVTVRLQPPVVPPNTGAGPNVATTGLAAALLAMLAGIASIVVGATLRSAAVKRV